MQEERRPPEDAYTPVSSQEGEPGTHNSVIFEPLKFRHLRVKNRVFRANISGRIDNYDGSGTQARINWEENLPGEASERSSPPTSQYTCADASCQTTPLPTAMTAYPSGVG